MKTVAPEYRSRYASLRNRSAASPSFLALVLRLIVRIVVLGAQLLRQIIGHFLYPSREHFIIINIHGLPRSIHHILLRKHLLDLAEKDWVLATGEFDVVELDLLPAGVLGGTVGLEAE